MTTTYKIKEARVDDADYTPYGGALNLVRYKGSEAIVSGPAETGKTLAALWKLHLCACKYPNASIVIVRKTLTSIYSTVLITFQNKVIKDCPVITPYGGEKPQWFDYSNGSRIWVAGMDKSSRILSAEHDIIYFNQVEEATLENWEVLTTRTTGRAGNMPYSQTIGDMNPAYPQHWVYHRKSLKVFYSFHNENPMLYDQRTGEITKQGKRTMAVLDALTGVRRIRLRDGKPALAEGAIYNWNDAIHLIDDPPKAGLHVASVDWGFSHPGVLGVWRLDGDGRMYLVRQIYQTGKTTDWWADKAAALNWEFGGFTGRGDSSLHKAILRGNDIDPDKVYDDAGNSIPLSEQLRQLPRLSGNGILYFVCDPSEPAYIEQFNRLGLKAEPAYNRVQPGIDAVQKRLKIQADGRPRLFVVRDSLREIDQSLKANYKPYAVEQEFPGYIWAGTNKEQPVKENDHGMDMVRYGVARLDGLGIEQKKTAGVW